VSAVKPSAAQVLALDADWNERSEMFIKSLGNYEVIQNTYQAPDRILKLTANYDHYNEEIFSSIEKGENVCLVILSTKEIAYLAKRLKAMKRAQEEWIRQKIMGSLFAV